MGSSEQVMTAEPALDDLEQADTGIGQPYDTAMRRWVERNLPTVAGWLDPAVAELPPTAFIQRPATFAVPSMVADLLITAGKSRLMHVEYETSPRKGLVARMFNYRARIMSLYPKTRLTQHVIVLENGRVRGHDDVRNGFLLDLRIMYVRERDPAEFLADPVLAPLAVLARGRRTRREHSFGAALRQGLSGGFSSEGGAARSSGSRGGGAPHSGAMWGDDNAASRRPGGPQRMKIHRTGPNSGQWSSRDRRAVPDRGNPCADSARRDYH